jgi:hypothetical protein
LVLLQPVLGTDLEKLQLDLKDYTADVNARQAELEAEEKEALASIIAERTGAYISDKATELGLTVSVQVETEPGEDGIPYPAAVEVEGPQSEELAAYMEEELGIPEERQVWTGT